MATGIKDFLSSIGMERHFNLFHLRGYDDESDIPHLNMSDLQTVGITDPMEIIIILKAAHSYRHTPEYDLFCWLRENGLSHYFEGFVQSDRILLTDIAQLNLPDEEVYDELEITLPGHKRRLERAVYALRKRQRLVGPEADEGVLVTEGWWGFPSYLPSAKFPFLCVKASIQSTCQPESQQSIDFMVDSGSDVSTLRNDIVQALDLEPITTVRSCGAHGSVRTTMYRAVIAIGDCRLETEVIGSSYDSLGSRVLRHFTHHIDNTRHKWFRGRNKPLFISTISGSQAVSNSGGNEDTEAETVSVLPESERGIYSRTAQENAGGSAGGGDGSGTSDSDGQGNGDGQSYSQQANQGDEMDSLLLPSQQNFATAFSQLSSAQRSRLPYTKHLHKSRSLLPSTGHQNKSHCNDPSRTTSSRDYPPPASYFPMFHERIPARSSESPVPSHEASLRTNVHVMASPGASQRTSTHQAGHVMISEDGTISLSFGKEIRNKKEQTDSGGS